jgi:hypothetical protein
MVNYRAAYAFLQLVRLMRVRRRIVRRYAVVPSVHPPETEPEPVPQPDLPSDGEGVPDVEVVVEESSNQDSPENSAAVVAASERPKRQAAMDAMEVILGTMEMLNCA